MLHFSHILRARSLAASSLERWAMAGDGGSEDPRVKPAPGGEDGVYYVEVRVETLVRAAPTRAPPDSLLPSGSRARPDETAPTTDERCRSVAPRVPRSLHLTNHAPFLSTRAERGHRTRRHVEGRVPVPAPRPPRLRIFRCGVQSARPTHRARRRAEASPGRAPDVDAARRVLREVVVLNRLDHPNIIKIFASSTPRHVGREGWIPTVHPGARVRRHVHGLEYATGGTCHGLRGHERGRVRSLMHQLASAVSTYDVGCGTGTSSRRTSSAGEQGSAAAS